MNIFLKNKYFQSSCIISECLQIQICAVKAKAILLLIKGLVLTALLKHSGPFQVKDVVKYSVHIVIQFHQQLVAHLRAFH